MTRADRIKEMKEMHAEGVSTLAQMTATLIDEFEVQLMHLEADLEEARDDLELEKDLTRKLKSQLEGITS